MITVKLRDMLGQEIVFNGTHPTHT